MIWLAKSMDVYETRADANGRPSASADKEAISASMSVEEKY